MLIEYTSKTHIGDRNINEDFSTVVIEDDWALFAVADGLGGHEGGELASKLFCQALSDLIKPEIDNFKESAKIAMRLLITSAAEVMSKQLIETNHDGAQTTCAVALLTKENLITAHVGDSRIYLFNSKKMLWRTKDHSMVQLLVDQGEIADEMMGQHPNQNLLLRSVSTYTKVMPEIRVCPALKQGELLLLCSDGFWEHITNDEMRMLVDTADLDDELEKLVALAVKRGHPKSDNVTVQAVRYIFN